MKGLKKRIALSALTAVMALSVFGGVALAGGEASASAAEINPIAKYEFKDETNFGKDSMGNYDMEYRNAYVADGTGALLDTATAITGGGVTFDGNFCVAQDAESNMFADVTAFTLCFEIKTDGKEDWQHYIGVGNSNDYFAFVGRSTSVKGQLRFNAHGVSSQYYDGAKVFDGNAAPTEFQKVVVSVQPGEEMCVYLNGSKITLTNPNAGNAALNTTIDTDWATATGNSFFSIGGRYNGAVDKTSKGSIRNVAFYDFAMDETCVTAYNTNGKVTVNDLSGMKYITGASVTFADKATSVALNSTMTEEAMLAAMNEGTAALTLSDGTTAETPITWTGIEKIEQTYFAKGTITTGKLGYANAFGTEIAYELTVAELKSLGEAVFAGEVLKGEVKDSMTEAEMLEQINTAEVTVTFNDDSTETVTVTFSSVKSVMGVYSAYADVVIGGNTFGTVSVIFDVTETNEGPTAELKPIALWTFDSEETKLKDTMGKYDLQGAARSGGNLANAYHLGEVQDGVLYLDGDSILALSQMNDIGDHVNNGFTLNFQYKQDGTYTTSQGWSAPVSFGAADFGSSVGAGFIVADGSDELRVQGHNITINMVEETPSLYWTQKVVEDGSERWHNVTLSVRPGQFFNAYVDGVLAYSEECPEGWNLEHMNMNFSIGGRCIWNNGYNLFKGWVDNVSVYNFAQTLDQSNAYWAKGKLVVGDMNGEIISSIADTPVFEGGTPLSGKLTDRLTATQATRRINDAVVAAVFANESTVDLPISWLGYEKEDGKWYIVGEVDASNIGYATLLTGKTKVKVEVEVERVARAVSVGETKNGTASADKTEAYLGDSVTITATPDKGYVVQTVSVNGVAISENDEGKYVYVVEGIEDVSIGVTFKAAAGGNGGSGTNGGGSDQESSSCGNCGSSIGLSVMAITTLAAAGLVCFKRKK
ncbi:MAG: hypothetical protein IJY62_05290 [Clostridia bacterium]|nr:hypothetical protein [Clostridia bacterium]